MREILIDLSKAFTAFHDLLLAKLATYGIDDNLEALKNFILNEEFNPLMTAIRAFFSQN